jgi:hypothetical protein
MCCLRILKYSSCTLRFKAPTIQSYWPVESDSPATFREYATIYGWILSKLLQNNNVQPKIMGAINICVTKKNAQLSLLSIEFFKAKNNGLISHVN